MAIDPALTNTVKVGELPTGPWFGSDLIPKETAGVLTQNSLDSLAAYISDYIGTVSSLAFNPTTVPDGGTLPATSSNEWILVGKGTFTNVGGGANITTTEELNALTSNGTFWSLAVEIPISVELAGIVQTIRSGFTTTAPSENAVFDALALKANSADVPLDANVVHKTGNESIFGIKKWFGQARFGLSDLGSFITSGRHLTQFVAGTDQTPLVIAAGTSSIEYFKDLATPRYAWATGMQNPSDNTDIKDSFKFFMSKDGTPYVQIAKLSEQGNFFTKGNFSENITTVTPTISGQPAIISYVNSLNVTQPVKLVIYFHGSGSNQLNPFTDTNSKYVIDKLLSEGYIVATSQAHGNAWGNQASQDDYLALYNYIITNYNINDVVFVGHSMGGITSLNMIAKNTIPAVSRWYGIMPATNLSEAYFTEGFASSIETAYGFSGSANYAAATAGNDPNLYAGSAYVNKKYTMTASSGDLTIIKTTNADLFNTKLTGAGISSYIVTATGVHGDISHFIPKHIFSFFRGTTIVKASQNVLPRVDNSGDLVDSAILDDGVNLNLTRNYRLTNSTPTSSLINSASSNKRWDMRVSGNDFMLTEAAVGNQIIVKPAGEVLIGTATASTGTVKLTVGGNVRTVDAVNVLDAVTLQQLTAAAALKLNINNPTATGTLTTPVLNISTSPAASAGSYEFLTRNTSTGVIEKLASTVLALDANVLHKTGNESAQGEKSFNNGTGKVVTILDTNASTLSALTVQNTTSAQNTIYATVGTSGKALLLSAPSGVTGSKYISSADNGVEKFYVNQDGTINGIKTYTALISQSGTSAPTVTVLGFNTIGAIVWTRSATGSYVGTLSGAFTASKTMCFINNTVVGSVTVQRATANTVTLTTADSTGTLLDGRLTDNSIKIEVYP